MTKGSIDRCNKWFIRISIPTFLLGLLIADIKVFGSHARGLSWEYYYYNKILDVCEMLVKNLVFFIPIVPIIILEIMKKRSLLIRIYYDFTILSFIAIIFFVALKLYH